METMMASPYAFEATLCCVGYAGNDAAEMGVRCGARDDERCRPAKSGEHHREGGGCDGRSNTQYRINPAKPHDRDNDSGCCWKLCHGRSQAWDVQAAGSESWFLGQKPWRCRSVATRGCREVLV